MLSDTDFLKRIVEIIEEGWRETEDFSIAAQSEYLPVVVKPEYLATVKIAEKFKTKILDSEHRPDYSLLLEASTEKVFTDCFSSKVIMRRNQSGGFRIVGRGRQNSTIRNGKFDIAIFRSNYYRDYLRSYCVIEVKNQESSFRRIKNDIERIEEILSKRVDEMESSLKYGILTFSRNLTKKFKPTSTTESNQAELLQKDKTKVIKKLIAFSHVVEQSSLISYPNDAEEYYLGYLFAIYTIIMKP